MWLSSFRRWLKFRYRIRIAYAFLSALGVRGTVQFFAYNGQRENHDVQAQQRIRVRKLKHPVLFRPGTSDLYVLREVLIDKVYDVVEPSDPSWILDCGANVGYASLFFLSRFPNCKVLAIEPEPGNFDLLSANLKPYQDRATALRAGVWSHDATVRISENRYRDGAAWSTQIEECHSEEPQGISAISIETLISQFNIERISLLKMDIEGAEAVVFADCHTWLRQIDNIIIELHNDSMFGNATDVFFRAIEGQGFDTVRDDAVAVCVRIPS